MIKTNDTFHSTKNAVLTEQILEYFGPKAQHMNAKHGGRAVPHSHDHTTAGILDCCQPSTNACRTHHSVYIQY